MTNENNAPEWELGDSITIRLDDDDEPDTGDDAAEPEDAPDA
jgi:hypothetical protein